MSLSVMIRWLFIVASGFLLVGCQASGGGATAENGRLINDVTQTPSIQVVDDAFIQFSVDDVALTINRPEGWEYYETDYGIVLAEYIGSVATDGRLDGLLTHVFVPPIDEFTLPTSNRDNTAWWVLSQIIENPEYVGSALVSDPVAFEWAGQDAAYYLMDNGEGNVTIVVGVVAPGTNRLVACSVSAPVGEASRIREVLPDLLDQLTINESVLDGSTLGFLPDPLLFPQY